MGMSMEMTGGDGGGYVGVGSCMSAQTGSTECFDYPAGSFCSSKR